MEYDGCRDQSRTSCAQVWCHPCGYSPASYFKPAGVLGCTATKLPNLRFRRIRLRWRGLSQPGMNNCMRPAADRLQNGIAHQSATAAPTPTASASEAVIRLRVRSGCPRTPTWYATA